MRACRRKQLGNLAVTSDCYATRGVPALARISLDRWVVVHWNVQTEGKWAR